MALRMIIDDKQPILRKVCKEVKDFDEKLWELLDDMKETLNTKKGAGLAAPQVGVLKRVFIIEVNNQYFECVNPNIVYTSGEQYDNDVEGCLSVSGVWGYVRRPNEVTLKAFDRFGYPFAITCEDYMARAICHENDHLNGVLFIDKMEEVYIPKKKK